MGLKLADTAQPMGAFPVAMAEHINFDDDESLQKKLDNGSLGSGDKIQYDILPLASAELLGKVVQFVGDTGTYQKGAFYECIEKDGSYIWDMTSSNPSWNGTKAQFEVLDKSTLKDGQTVNLTDDYKPNNYATTEYVDEKVLDVYSTDEVVVGKWIDGKPLYRKVFIGLNLSFSATTGSWGTLSTSLDLDYDTLIKVDVYRGKYKVSSIVVSSLNPITYHSLNIPWSGCDMLVVEYTKTTD